MPTLIRNAPHHKVAATELETSRNNGRLQLVRWHQDGNELAFVYSRSHGGLMQTGRCRIVRLTQEIATLDALGCKLVVALSGARYEHGPQQFFTPDLLSRFNVNGVAVCLENHDWMFFSPETMPSQSLQLDPSTYRPS